MRKGKGKGTEKRKTESKGYRAYEKRKESEKRERGRERKRGGKRNGEGNGI